MNAARIGRQSRIAKIFFVLPIFRKVSLSVEATNRYAGNGRKASMAVLVNIDTGGCSNRFLGTLIQRWIKRFFPPAFLGIQRMPVLVNIRARTFGDLRLDTLGVRLGLVLY